MKLAITASVLPSDSKNGAGYQAHHMANAFMRRGHRVTLFSMSPRPTDALYDHTIIPRFSRLTIWRYAYSLRSLDYHSFDGLLCLGDDCFLMGKKRPHHVRIFEGSCLAEAIHARSIEAKIKMAAIGLGEYVSCMVADELVAISNNTRRYIPAARTIIPCGVNLEAFSPGFYKSPVPTLLFVGTLDSRKRGDMLLDLFRREIRPRVPSAEFWAVCGDVPEGEGVRCFGRVSEDVLTDLYRRAWAFCLPSTYEGFGVPYIEAMASGTPVVATPNVGAREVLQDGRCGLVVPDNQLADALVHVLTHESERARLRAAGLERAQDFSWNRVCEQYESIFAKTNSHALEASTP